LQNPHSLGLGIKSKKEDNSKIDIVNLPLNLLLIAYANHNDYIYYLY